MRRAWISALVATCLLAPVAVSLADRQPVPRPAPVLLAFGGHFGGGGFHFGGGLGRRSGGGLFGRSRSRTGLFGRRGFLHRLVRAAVIVYFLHLFFSHGGLSVLLWLVIIGLVLHLVRRRRRRLSY